MSTSTRQQIAEVIERALEPYGSLPIDAAAALVARPELLRALADERQPAALAAAAAAAQARLAAANAWDDAPTFPGGARSAAAACADAAVDIMVTAWGDFSGSAVEAQCVEVDR